MFTELAHFFKEGGFFMYLNLAFLGVSIAIVIERTIAIVFRLNLNASAFMSQVQKLILSNNIDRAIKLCAAAPNAALSRVIKAGLTRANRGEREISKALEEAVVETTPLISKRIPALWSLANIATLVGLVGTIFGLIGTFKSLAAASPEMKQVMLSKGISEAMNNTAFGLLIAVICIVCHLLLNTKSRQMVEELEFQALRLENMLSRHSVGDTNPLDRA